MHPDGVLSQEQTYFSICCARQLIGHLTGGVSSCCQNRQQLRKNSQCTVISRNNRIQQTACLSKNAYEQQKGGLGCKDLGTPCAWGGVACVHTLAIFYDYPSNAIDVEQYKQSALNSGFMRKFLCTIIGCIVSKTLSECFAQATKAHQYSSQLLNEITIKILKPYEARRIPHHK